MPQLKHVLLINELTAGVRFLKHSMFHRDGAERAKRVSEQVESDWLNTSCYERSYLGWTLNTIQHTIVVAHIAGDNDKLEAFERFSVIENPTLPFTVDSLRAATGKHKVSHLLMQEHLDVHRRMVNNKEVLSNNPDITDHQLKQLATLVLLNMEHTDAILDLVVNRNLTRVSDIVAAFNKTPQSLVG